MSDDAELLERYACRGDESSFRTLVDRHVNLVHSAALRQLNGDAHAAADVTQAVFVDLARKARALTAHPVLSAWLLMSTRYAAGKFVRGEQRRRSREREAHFMNEANDGASIDWTRAQCVLDEVLATLSDADRQAIVLRFFEGRDYGAISTRLNVADNTARMRVERALDKLRVALGRRGVTSTRSALAVALANQAVLAAPAGLAAQVSAAALTQAAGVSATLFFMGMTKLQVAITAAVVAAGAAGVVAQSRSNAVARAQVAALEQRLDHAAEIRTATARLQAQAAEAAVLRAEDSEWTRLRDEAAALKVTLAAASAAAPDASKDRLPELRSTARPVYPETLLRDGVSGEAVIGFIVSDKGEVANAYPVGSTRPEFGTAALEAVRQSTFLAGLKAGRVVHTNMKVKVEFNAARAEATIGKPEPVTAEQPKWF